MDNFRECLDIIFRQMQPMDVINSYYKRNSLGRKLNFNKELFIDTSSINETLFTNTALNEFNQYSEDEIINLYSKLDKEWMMDNRQLYKDGKSIFNLLLSFGEDILIEYDGIPQCRYEQILRWRETSHKLGQDIFTTSYLAYQDSVTRRDRNYFQWSPIISTNNIRLYNLLKNGLAENHFHLKGSAPTWDLTWISLMNKVEKRKKQFTDSGINIKKLEPELSFSSRSYQNDYYSLFKIAAVIRVFLFAHMNNTYLWDANIDIEEKKLEKYITDDFFMETNVSELQSCIDELKSIYGKKYSSYRKKDDYIIDYAITNNLTDDGTLVNHYFSGERYFLYNMFKKVYDDDKNIIQYSNLFYSYLLIKSKLRHEFVQANTRIGFKNFSDYQDRKTVFLKNDPILSDAVYATAICGTIINENVESLEARIAPEDNPHKISREINNIDQIVNYSSKDYLNNKQYFYVIHFIKSKDKDVHLSTVYTIKPRHYKKRIEVKKNAVSIAKIRNNTWKCAERICGIDACSNEIGCRPEVFAQAFRYLRSSESTSIQSSVINFERLPRLGATYHAGEDFLDVIDGLRSIDEAIQFLNLSSGDRIGHALALGVDVVEWYNFKKKRLLLTKQDYLDNIVWMLIKIKEFNIPDLKNLVYILEESYYQIFLEIYQNNFLNEDDRKNKFYTHRKYYDAWRLRGNDPMLYDIPNYKEKEALDSWNRQGVNIYFPKEKHVREDEDVQFLYHSYHFNQNVRKKGSEIMEFCVSDEYINAAIQIQHKMQLYIRNLGIGIETNPSSNFLIGTFKRYEKHPIVNMYNIGLTSDPEKINNCPQLFVSINTDDQGIFDTSIENEYALMAAALEKSKNPNGSSKYTSAMIYDWLDKIRRMGLEQVFNK